MLLDAFYVGEWQQTVDESWALRREPGHFYGAQADFALRTLGAGPGECLVVGSPCFEAMELAAAGWSVTYADVRVPPVMGAGVRNLLVDVVVDPLPMGAFDCASSTCVMCHLGMGRYGDEEVEGADILALANIHRALKDGGRFVVTWGPVSFLCMPVLAPLHRIYTIEAARDRAREAGFTIAEERMLDGKTLEWKAGIPNVFEFDRDYLTTVLVK
jgi:SAM-dependent methyltransferase